MRLNNLDTVPVQSEAGGGMPHIGQRTSVMDRIRAQSCEKRESHLAGAELFLPGLERGRHKLGGDDYEEQLCMLHHLCRISRGPHAFRALVALQSRPGTCLFGDSFLPV